MKVLAVLAVLGLFIAAASAQYYYGSPYGLYGGYGGGYPSYGGYYGGPNGGGYGGVSTSHVFF